MTRKKSSQGAHRHSNNPKTPTSNCSAETSGSRRTLKRKNSQTKGSPPGTQIITKRVTRNSVKASYTSNDLIDPPTIPPKCSMSRKRSHQQQSSESSQKSGDEPVSTVLRTRHQNIEAGIQVPRTIPFPSSRRGDDSFLLKCLNLYHDSRTKNGAKGISQQRCANMIGVSASTFNR